MTSSAALSFASLASYCSVQVGWKGSMQKLDSGLDWTMDWTGLDYGLDSGLTVNFVFLSL